MKKMLINSTDLWKKLQCETRPIVLYGTGNGAQAVLAQLGKYGVKVQGIFASDSFARGQVFCGHAVGTYGQLAQKYPDMVILVCFGSNRKDVLENIERLSVEHDVYCPDVPVYGDNIFTLEYAHEHHAEIEMVYQLLEDDLSKKTYEAIISFKLTGKSSLLQAVEYTGSTFSPLALGNEESYLDLGAYRGDTVEEFLKTVEDYDRIYALEPNRKTFLKLKQNTENVRNIIQIQAAISDHEGETVLRFAGRGSSVQSGGETVQMTTVDSLLKGQAISLIKIDVEGQEEAAICGAKKTISKFRPKMIVAGYHRSEDIFALPLLVHQIQSDYRILIRHFRHNLAWDTNFYFI